MLITLSGAVPPLLNVTVCAGLVVRTFCEANVSFNGETDAAGPPVVPVPVRLIDCGLPVALSVIEIAAVRVPAALGVNVTLMVQLFAAITAAPQVLVWAKSAPFAPVMVILEMDKVALPMLNNVTPPAGLVVPTEIVPNEIVEVLKVTEGAVPTPLSAAVCGLPAALSTTEMAAWRVPGASGLNNTPIVQFVPGASEVPQVLVSVKSPLLGPVTLMEVMVNVAFPGLLSVMTLAGLVVPTV